MAKKQDQTASFMVRFNQRIYEENGESNVQWRGKISHIQGDDEVRFSDFNDALLFMQKKLGELTEEATKNESPEEREGILKKSLGLWNTMKEVGPKIILDTIKDPKKQIAQFQDQLQDQISHLGDEIGEKVHFDQWRKASRADYNDIKDSIQDIKSEMEKLGAKIDALNSKK